VKKGHLGRSVSIIGAAYTPLGDVRSSPEILNFSERELFSLACMEAMENGGIEAKDIDAFYVGISGPNYDAKLKSGAPFFADWIGMKNKPSLFHDEGCGTSGYGLQMAVLAVASGMYDCVISGAVNINKSVPKYAYPPHIRVQQDPDVMWAGIWTGIDAAYQKPGSSGLASLESSLFNYCSKHGINTKQVEEIFINYLLQKRKEALLNPKALMSQKTYEDEAKGFGFDSVKDYLLSNKYNPLMTSMVRHKFIGLVVDGASAVIVCSSDMAKQFSKKPIEVAGMSSVCMAEHETCEIPGNTSTKMFKESYAMCGITNPFEEVEYMGIHDCPATTVLVGAEGAGYIKEGEAWKYMLEGRVNFDCEKPISATGGRLQVGHPRSPAFVVEVAEAVSQMRGESGPRQMKNPPKTSVIYGGGSGISMCTCVLKTP